MNVNANTSMQQTQMRKMDGSGGGQGNGGAMGKMMKETMSLLPEDTQADIQALMQTLDPAAKQEAKAQMTQIETANMTVEDLTAAIMDIFRPEQTPSTSSFPSSFSVYA